MALHVMAVDDILACEVCLFLTPNSWCLLRTAHSRLKKRLALAELQWLFSRQLQGRLTRMPAFGISEFLASVKNGSEEVPSLVAVVSLASSVDTISEVIGDIAAHPALVCPRFVLVRQVMSRLHTLALQDRQLHPKERSGRRSSLPKRLLRTFASFSGLMHRLCDILRVFPLEVLPPDVFVVSCEVIASLIHNAKDAKRSFVAVGGLTSLLRFLQAHPRDAEIQAAGLATLLALSARSVINIRLMVEHQTHEVVTIALQTFPTNSKVVTRATGLLANMSNVPCVCPELQRCGAFTLARDLLLKQPQTTTTSGTSAPFLRDFVQHLISNLEDDAAQLA